MICLLVRCFCPYSVVTKLQRALDPYDKYIIVIHLSCQFAPYSFHFTFQFMTVVLELCLCNLAASLQTIFSCMHFFHYKTTMNLALWCLLD